MKRGCSIYGGGIARLCTMGAKRFVHWSVGKYDRKIEETEIRKAGSKMRQTGSDD